MWSVWVRWVTDEWAATGPWGSYREPGGRRCSSRNVGARVGCLQWDLEAGCLAIYGDGDGTHGGATVSSLRTGAATALGRYGMYATLISFARYGCVGGASPDWLIITDVALYVLACFVGPDGPAEAARLHHDQAMPRRHAMGERPWELGKLSMQRARRDRRAASFRGTRCARCVVFVVIRD